MASTCPARASFTACSMECPAILPARTTRLRSEPLSPLPRPQVPTDCFSVAGRASIWSGAPTRMMSASMGWRSAAAVISGPIPRGSPSVMAIRGPFPRFSVFSVFSVLSLPSDLDVGRVSQPVEVVANGELLAQLLPNAVADVLVLDLACGTAIGHLEHHELLPIAGAGDAKDREDRALAGVADRLAVVLRQLVDGDIVGDTLGRGVVIEPLE